MHPSSDMRLLLVDNDPDYLASLQNLLEVEDYQFAVAASVEEAIALLDERTPDVVISDVMMPRLDGYQTCTLIRNAEDTRNTPVVMLSSSDGIFDIAKGQARGATAHVTKIPPEQVLRELIFNHTQRQVAA